MYFTVHRTGVWKLHAPKQQIHRCKFNSCPILRCLGKKLAQFLLRLFEAFLKQCHHEMHSLALCDHKLLLFLVLQVFIFQDNVHSKINALSASLLSFAVLGICLIFVFRNITDSKIHACIQIPFHFFLDFPTGLKCKIHTFLIFFLFRKQKYEVILSCSRIIITQHLYVVIVENFLKNINTGKFFNPFVAFVKLFFPNYLSSNTYNVFFDGQLKGFRLLLHHSFSLKPSIEKISCKFRP